MTIEGLLANVEELQRSFATDKVMGRVLRKQEDAIIAAQRLQLFEGKDSEGNDLRPYYSEDLQPEGWFKSKDSAMRYAMWKQTGISYPVQAQRNADAPNLYINGKFHSEMQVGFMEERVGIIPSTPYAAMIMGKYGMNKFGLQMQKWGAIMEAGKDDLIKRMKEIIYG